MVILDGKSFTFSPLFLFVLKRKLMTNDTVAFVYTVLTLYRMYSMNIFRCHYNRVEAVVSAWVYAFNFDIQIIVRSNINLVPLFKRPRLKLSHSRNSWASTGHNSLVAASFFFLPSIITLISVFKSFRLILCLHRW